MHSQQFFHIILIWVLVINAGWIPSPPPPKSGNYLLILFAMLNCHIFVLFDSLTANKKRLTDFMVRFPGLCSSPGIVNKFENTSFRKLNLLLSSDEGKEIPTMMRSLNESWPKSLDTYSISFKPWPLFPWRNVRQYPLDRRPTGLRNRSGRCGGKETSVSPTGNQTPAVQPVAIPTELPRLP
jgi:hypothetical protein